MFTYKLDQAFVVTLVGGSCLTFLIIIFVVIVGMPSFLALHFFTFTFEHGITSWYMIHGTSCSRLVQLFSCMMLFFFHIYTCKADL